MTLSQEYLENLYLELGDTSAFDIKNPIDIYSPKEKTAEELIKIGMDPRYVGFTAKHFLGVNLFPYQMAVLNEIWNKRLPILIATRGGAKTTMLGITAILKAML
jgi:hypothetical protein